MGCISYLVLHNKSPPKLSAFKQQLTISHSSVSWLGSSSAGLVFVHPHSCMQLAGWLGGQSKLASLMCLVVGTGWLVGTAWFCSIGLSVSCRPDSLPQVDRDPSLPVLRKVRAALQGHVGTQATSLLPCSIGQSKQGQSKFKGVEKWTLPLDEMSPKVTLKKGVPPGMWAWGRGRGQDLLSLNNPSHTGGKFRTDTIIKDSVMIQKFQVQYQSS